MKTQLYIFLVGLFALATACDEKEEPYSPPSDPEKAILGKWELMELYQYDATVYQPTGYVEYLPDSIFGWYDYSTKKYERFEGKYWIESVVYPEGTDNILVLHYQNTWIDEEKYQYEYYPDKPYGNNFGCSFSGNQLELYTFGALSQTKMPTYIYKRKK
jgi:hypothetical protein